MHTLGAWILIANYVENDLKTLVRISNINKECKKIIFENYIYKKWQESQVAELLRHKNDQLSLCVIKKNQASLSLYWLFERACDNDCENTIMYLLDHVGINPGAYCNCIINLLFRRNRLNTIERLLKDVRFFTFSYHQELIKRVYKSGKFEMVKSLTNDRRTDFRNLTLLICKDGNLEMMKFLLCNKRFNPNVGDGVLITTALQHNHMKIAYLLLQDERMKLKSIYIEGIFQCAVQNKRYDLVQFLLSSDKIDPTSSDNFLVEWVIKRDDVKCIEILLQHWRVSANNVLYHACVYNRPEIVKLLLKNKEFDPSCSFDSPIYAASRYGYLEIVKLLLEDKRVATSKTNTEIVTTAIEKQNWDIVKLLLSDKRFSKFKIVTQYFKNFIGLLFVVLPLSKLFILLIMLVIGILVKVIIW